MNIVSTETKSKNIRKGIEKCLKEVVDVSESSSFYSNLSELYFLLGKARKFNREHPNTKNYLPVENYENQLKYVELQMKDFFDQLIY